LLCIRGALDKETAKSPAVAEHSHTGHATQNQANVQTLRVFLAEAFAENFDPKFFELHRLPHTY